MSHLSPKSDKRGCGLPSVGSAPPLAPHCSSLPSVWKSPQTMRSRKMYVVGPCISISDKSTCAPGDDHNFVIVYEEQEGIVTGNKRRIHLRGKEVEREK